MAIAVEHLTKFYGDHLALDAVSFEIQAGEVIGFLGLNGAGKSTLLNMICGLLPPSKGSLNVYAVDVKQNPARLKPLIGYLPDHPPLYEEMSVRAYLKFAAKLKGITAKQLEAGLGYATEKTSLREVIDVPIYELSHGYRQRVGIAQALVHQPKVIILDEPIKGLDPIQIMQMRDLIKSLRDEHTVLLSSHILTEVTKTCDRMFILNQGKLIASGREDELAQQLSAIQEVHIEVGTADIQGLAQQMTQLHGVVKVESQKLLPAERWSLTVTVESDIRDQLASYIVSQQIPLYGLVSSQTGLESLFVKLVSGQERQGGQQDA